MSRDKLKKINPSTDIEADKIAEENDEFFELVNHGGWRRARARMVEKILELQNVAEYMDIIQTGNATKLLKEMKASARAAEILFDWLRQIEGGADQAKTDKEIRMQKSFIVRLDEELV